MKEDDWEPAGGGGRGGKPAGGGYDMMNGRFEQKTDLMRRVRMQLAAKTRTFRP